MMQPTVGVVTARFTQLGEGWVRMSLTLDDERFIMDMPFIQMSELGAALIKEAGVAALERDNQNPLPIIWREK